MHPSQSATLTIANGTGPFTTSIDTPLVTVTVDQTARTVTVAASQQTGRATIALNDSTGASVQIPVRVALDAGSVPSAIAVRVTGTQLAPQWLTLIVQRALLRAMQVQPGAAAQVAAFTVPQTLGPGASAAIPVPVSIAGGDTYFDVPQTSVSVTVQNVDTPAFLTPVLYYDDDPEKVTEAGVLFRGQIAPNSPARLYYYHQNSGENRRLAVVLSSASAQPSTVQLIDASAGPNIDVMSVGHAVSRDFLMQKPLNEGIVIDIAPPVPYVAEQFPMKPLDGAAGSIGINVLTGGPVTATVVALPAGGDVSANEVTPYLTQPRLPGDGHHRTGAFLLTNYAQDVIPYTIPGADASKQYGAQTPPAAQAPGDPVTAGHDYGEYGVVRNLNFQITNPLDQPATLYLYERPLGGAVRSSFLVDGQLVQVGCARVSDRYQIGDPITVQPHARLTLPVQTMTDGGSNYPLEVGLTQTAPQPAAPPINAPDGCFPKPQTAPPAPQGTPAASPVPSPVPEPTG